MAYYHRNRQLWEYRRSQGDERGDPQTLRRYDRRRIKTEITNGRRLAALRKEWSTVETSDVQFKAFLRLVIRDLTDALNAATPEETDRILKALMSDFQKTLED